MLKWAASLILNPLFVIALVWLALNANTRTNCQAGVSLPAPFERVLSGFRQLTRALD